MPAGYALVFMAGLVSSGHCLAMCGIFPIALRAGGRGIVRGATIQALYLLGKTTTYVFLGVVAASAGLRLEGIQRPLGLLAGLLLIVMGVVTLLPRSTSPRIARWIEGSPLCTMLSGLLRDPRPSAALSTGVFNGFVPCGIVYAMVAYAASTGTVAAAALTMLLFGLGTAPALLALGISSRIISLPGQTAPGGTAVAGTVPSPGRWARGLAAFSGIVMLALGALTLWRSLSPTAGHLGHLLGASC